MPRAKAAKAAHKTKRAQADDDDKKVRQVKQPTYKSFRLSKRIRQPKAPIKNSFSLFIACIRALLKNWRLFGGIVLVYLVLTIVLVKGLGGNSTFSQLQSAVEGLFHGASGQLKSSVALFSILLTNSGSAPTDIASAYQTILLLIVSLTLIWALRQAQEKSKKTRLTVRDCFYKGLYPLVPFLLVLLVVALQLGPLLLGSYLYGAIFTNGVARILLEDVIWGSIIFGLVILSFYMITSSVFALYIVTLPNVVPMAALRSARELVRHRRWEIMRKVIFLPVFLLLAAALIMLPAIIWVPRVAEWLFFVLSMLSLAVVHSYMYGLYRELLKR